MSRHGECILKWFSRNPNERDYLNEKYEKKHSDLQEYVRNLKSSFPNLEHHIKGKRVLDIGCSNGMESLALLEIGAYDVIGIDIRIKKEKVDALKVKYPNRNMTFIVMDASEMMISDEQFDVVITCGSFEHFGDPEKVMTECKRVLRPGGKVLVTSGVWSNPWAPT